MFYTSEKTPKGNLGMSYDSQSAADERARLMDENNCTGCINCTDCIGCSHCTDCTDCIDCTDCRNCSHCTDCADCRNCHYCTDCINCRNCSNCINCSNCSDCSHCSGALKWRGPTCDRLISVNGLYWPVAISSTHMQIGCQNHSHEEWKAYNHDEIHLMDRYRALGFWVAHKSMLLSMCDLRASPTFEDN